MKKLSLLLAVVLMLSICSFAVAAGSDFRDLNLKELKLVYINSATTVTNEEIDTIFGFNLAETTLLVPTYSEMVAALQSGRADYTFLPYTTAQYLVKSNPDLYKLSVLNNVVIKLQMILRDTDTELADKISSAVMELKENGKIYAMLETLVYGVDNVSEANAASEATLFEGKNTLYVGVSGELPPMDYVAADGRAAGFNVALVQQVAEQLEMNVVFVVIPSEAKYQALLSGKIDVFFSHTSGGMHPLAEGIVGTEPYLFTGFAYVGK